MLLKLAEYIPLALLSVLLTLLLVRRTLRDFPWFTSYVGFAVCADVARFVVRNRAGAYLVTYWTTEGFYDLLGICVMYEVFRRIFGNLGRWGWPRFVFPVQVAISVVLTIGRGEGIPSGLHDQTLQFIILAEIAVRFLEVLMFVALTALVPLAGLQWRQHAFGIATGFGVYSTIALLTTTRFSALGQVYHLSWGWALIASYSCAVLIWIWFFSTTEKPASAGGSAPTLSFTELSIYRKLLRRINK